MAYLDADVSLAAHTRVVRHLIVLIRHGPVGDATFKTANQSNGNQHNACWLGTLCSGSASRKSSITTTSSFELPSTPLALIVFRPEVRRTRLILSPVLATAPAEAQALVPGNWGPLWEKIIKLFWSKNSIFVAPLPASTKIAAKALVVAAVVVPGR